jgi:hypothetical protein
VDQALSRLVKSGKLLRVARGSYTATVSSRFGSRAPAPRNVVEALAALTGEAVVVHGAASANALGLTQQVPIREAYLTTGRTRKLQVGRSEVIVRQAPRWMFALGSRPGAGSGIDREAAPQPAGRGVAGPDGPTRQPAVVDGRGHRPGGAAWLRRSSGSAPTTAAKCWKSPGNA